MGALPWDLGRPLALLAVTAAPIAAQSADSIALDTAVARRSAPITIGLSAPARSIGSSRRSLDSSDVRHASPAANALRKGHGGRLQLRRSRPLPGITISIEGRNLVTWTRYRGPDPEVATATARRSSQQPPMLPALPRTIGLRVEVVAR